MIRRFQLRSFQFLAVEGRVKTHFPILMEVGSTCIDVDFLYKHRCSRLFIHEDADGTFRIRLQSLHLTHSFQVARLSNITAWLKVVQGMELFYSPSVLSGCIREMPLYRLREVKLMSCNVVHSLEAMQNVRNVEILNCAAIENFDGLNNAFDIKIVRCDMLYNIDGMNLSRYINLEACKNLTGNLIVCEDLMFHV